MLFNWLQACLPQQNIPSIQSEAPRIQSMMDETSSSLVPSSSIVPSSVKRSPTHKRNQEKAVSVVIWTRISSEKQSGNMSLDMQEREAKKYIETHSLGKNSITLNMVGSGYTVDESIQQNIDLLHTLIDRGDSVILVCYMPDRLLRNYQVASDILDKIASSEGSVHFVKGPEGKPLVTTQLSDMPIILDCLRLAQNDSKLRSQRSQDSKHNAMMEKIKQHANEVNVSRIISFITLFLKGGSVEDIYKAFRACVDWELYPDWKKLKYNRQSTYYQVPFYIDGTILTEDRLYVTEYITEEDLTTRCKCIVGLLRSYKVDVPDVFIGRKRWTLLFIQQLGGIEEIDMISSRLTSVM